MPERMTIDQYKNQFIKTPKWKAKIVKFDGYTFRSEKEYKRYLMLKEWQRIGVIKNLKVAPRYVFKLNNIIIGSYTADAEYDHVIDMNHVVEDSKGAKYRKVKGKFKKNGEQVKAPTTEYSRFLKQKRMMKAFYNIDVQEV